MAKWWCSLAKEKLYLSAYRGLGKFISLLARKLSKPEDGRYRPKHVVFSFVNKHNLAIYL